MGALQLIIVAVLASASCCAASLSGLPWGDGVWWWGSPIPLSDLGVHLALATGSRAGPQALSGELPLACAAGKNFSAGVYWPIGAADLEEFCSNDACPPPAVLGRWAITPGAARTSAAGGGQCHNIAPCFSSPGCTGCPQRTHCSACCSPPAANRPPAAAVMAYGDVRNTTGAGALVLVECRYRCTQPDGSSRDLDFVGYEGQPPQQLNSSDCEQARLPAPSERMHRGLSPCRPRLRAARARRQLHTRGALEPLSDACLPCSQPGPPTLCCLRPCAITVCSRCVVCELRQAGAERRGGQRHLPGRGPGAALQVSEMHAAGPPSHWEPQAPALVPAGAASHEPLSCWARLLFHRISQFRCAAWCGAFVRHAGRPTTMRGAGCRAW